jgi:arylsulfatase
LYVDGKRVGEGTYRATHAFLFSMDETMDVGRDVGGSVSTDYDAKSSEFNGKINWVQIDVDAAAQNEDHTIGAEERFMVAMARQ